MVPELSSYGVSEDTLRCEGVCDIRVLYLDAKGETLLLRLHQGVFRRHQGEIRPGEGRGLGAGLGGAHHLPGCQRPPAGPPPAVSLKPWRVVQRQEQLTSGLEGEGIQVRGERRSASQAVNALSHQFTLEDRLPLKNGKPLWSPSCARKSPAG